MCCLESLRECSSLSMLLREMAGWLLGYMMWPRGVLLMREVTALPSLLSLCRALALAARLAGPALRGAI